jgi:hypothetical protein
MTPLSVCHLPYEPSAAGEGTLWPEILIETAVWPLRRPAMALPVSSFVAEAPRPAIYMKLSVDSLHQCDGFVLFCQTFSEDLSRGVSFS